MSTEDIRGYVKRAKSDVEEVKRQLSNVTSFVDLQGQHGSYVYSQLNSLKSKLDEAETELRRALNGLGS